MATTTARIQYGPFLKPLSPLEKLLVQTFAAKMTAKRYQVEQLDMRNTLTVIATRHHNFEAAVA